MLKSRVLVMSALVALLGSITLGARGALTIAEPTPHSIVPASKVKTDWATLPTAGHIGPFSALVYLGPGEDDVWVTLETQPVADYADTTVPLQRGAGQSGIFVFACRLCKPLLPVAVN